MAKMVRKQTKTALNKNLAGKSAMKKTTKESKKPMTKKETKIGSETNQSINKKSPCQINGYGNK